MSKKGMKRPDNTKKPKNTLPPVTQINGGARYSNERANPIIVGSTSPVQKTYHTSPPLKSGKKVYSIFDSELAEDNLQNDNTAADLQDI